MLWRVKLRYRTGISQGRRTLTVEAGSGARAAWLGRTQFARSNPHVKEVRVEEAFYLGPHTNGGERWK